MNKTLRTTIAAAAMAIVGSGASAAALTYDFTWSGDGALTMNGSFTGTDSNMDGLITDSEVSALSFEAFDGATSLGSTSGAQALTGGFSAAFNFNFDLIAGTFQNGNSVSGLGQFWNAGGPGLGFFDGDSSAGFKFNGSNITSQTNDPQVYTATLQDVAVVPLPASLPLLLVGMAGFAAVGRRKTSA